MSRNTGGGSLLAALLIAGTGCYKATFISNPNAVRGVEHDEWESFWIFGLVGEQDLDVRQFCPEGHVAEVRTGANFGTGIVSVITLGIYAPRKVYVTCAANRSASLELFANREGEVVAAVRHRGGSAERATVTRTTRGVELAFAGGGR